MTLHLLAALALTGCALGAATVPAQPDARIVVDRQPDRYVVVGLYTGSITDELTYQLEVTREGTGGRSQSSQSGAVRGDTLSTSTVNVTEGDRVVARLTVHDGDRVIAEDRLDEVVGG